MTLRPFHIVAAAAFLLSGVLPAAADWLAFRGDTTGSATAVTVPQSEADARWRLDMPGRSVASPIVIGDTVITTSSAGPDGEDLFISGVSLDTGELRFEHRFEATGRPFHYQTSACAAPTPVSDGETVVAYFSSGDVFALTIDGKFLWTRSLGLDYPAAGNDLGLAASPVIADGVVVVTAESVGDSYAAGLDLRTGETLWRLDRPQQSNWSTPVAMTRGDGSSEVLLPSGKHCVAIDPRTGEENWRLPIGAKTITSPVVVGRTLLVPGEELIALSLESTGQPVERWRSNKLAPDNPSIIARGDRLYTQKGSVLLCGNLADGSLLWRKRLDDVGQTWSTPIIAGDHLYLSDQTGKLTVVQDLGDEAEQLSQIDLGQPLYATPAVAAGRLIIRAYESLISF